MRNRHRCAESTRTPRPPGGWKWVILPGEGLKGVALLGIDPAFDGMTFEAKFLLCEAQSGASRYAYLLNHEVNTSDHLRDRMLHLKSGIHLDKIKFSIFIKELRRCPNCDSPDRASLERRSRRYSSTLRLIESRRGRLLPDFLVTALKRAIALAQMKDLPEPVGKHLDFDVTRSIQILFDIYRVVGERRLCFGTSGCKCKGQFLGLARNFMPLPPPPAAAFSTGYPSRGRFGRALIAFDRAVRPGHGEFPPGPRPVWRRSCRP